ncbi:MAG: hypothetical protein JNL50_03535 [Phycisphaerae bacterium]|nr:hypothetical protein [Phycisphaerae bacterium]
MPIRLARVAVILAAFVSPLAPAQPTDPAPIVITEKLRADAAALAPLVTSELARDFLDATSLLAEPAPRVVYRNREKGLAVSQRVFDRMTTEEQAILSPRQCPPQFYYETGYGSPLVYVRLLELAAPHAARDESRKLLDFGYGSIGQLHLLSHLGFEAHGVDVEPMLEALYSEPADTGPVGRGLAQIHTGQWPAEPALRKSIGGGYSIITSKNTLKAGYIHPTPPEGQVVDERKLVKLGVSDAMFLKSVHDALRPAGLFIIYNICPPQNPPDKEYIPWADGKSPWSRQEFNDAGFDVLALDVDDQAWVLDCFEKLGYTDGKPREQAAKDYFCWYTILKRKD